MESTLFGFTLSWAWFISILLLILKAAIILVAGHFAIVLLIKLIKQSFKKISLDLSLEKFLIKVVNIVLHVIVILSALSALGISTTGMLAALSAVAAAVALALKDSLSNIAGGILLLISPRFTTGDFVEIGGESGNVLQIDMLHTTLKTLDNRHVIIPNGVVINNQLINYSSEEMRRLDMTFSIGYDDDAKEAEQIILSVIASHPYALKEPDVPFVRVGEYSSSSVDIIARVWCESKNYWQLKFDLLEQVRAEFDEKGISIPYNQLDVHISNN